MRAVAALGREQQLRLVAEAGRAPSAHNAQPARWRVLPGGRVALYEDTRRRLTVGDPDARDARVGLGAAFEGMHLALSHRGLALGEPRLLAAGSGLGAAPPDLEPIAEASIVPGRGPDPLGGEVFRRHTYRGDFMVSTADQVRRLRRRLAADEDVVAIDRPAEVAEIAELHDRCTWSFMAEPAYQKELYAWLRFSPHDPGWDRDGLTVDCLALSRAERVLARAALSSRGFRVLKALGLGRALVSEAAAVRSASAVAVLHRPVAEDPFHAGRRLYRLWLELSRDGFHLCPMSATADSPDGEAHLRRHLALPSGSRVINVLRIGVAPPGPAEAVTGVSRRLPPDELLV